MRTYGLSFLRFGGVRLRVRAVVIGAGAIVCGTAHVTLAGVNIWTSNGPYAGVHALTIDRTLPNTLYAGTGNPATSNGVVFRSTDSGASWSAVSTGLNDLYIFALAIDPTRPGTVYAGGDGHTDNDGRVYVSTNSGDTWSPILSGPLLAFWELAIAPTTSSTIYAGIANPWAGIGGVFQSTNGGGSWSAADTA